MLTGRREILPTPCFFECGQRMEKSFAPVAGVEFLQGLEFVVHFWSSFRAERNGVEESHCVSLKFPPRDPSTLARDDNVPVVIPAPLILLSLC